MACQNSARNIERAAWSNLMSTPRGAKNLAAKHVADPIAPGGESGDAASKNQAPHDRELVRERAALLGCPGVARFAQMPLHDPDSRSIDRHRHDHPAQRA